MASCGWRTLSAKKSCGAKLSKPLRTVHCPSCEAAPFRPTGKPSPLPNTTWRARGTYPSAAQQKITTLKVAQRSAMLLEGLRLDIELRSVADGRILRTFFWPLPLPPHTINSDRLTQGVALAFSPDGQNLLGSLPFKTQLFFRYQAARFGQAYLGPRKTNLMTETTIVAFSPNGKLLAICRSDLIEVYDAKTFQLLQIFRAAARVLAFSPDGKWLACDDSMEMQRVFIWETGSLH